MWIVCYLQAVMSKNRLMQLPWPLEPHGDVLLDYSANDTTPVEPGGFLPSSHSLYLKRVNEPTSELSMRFVLIDRILDVQPGRTRLVGSTTYSSPGPSLVAVKNLSLAEEYLSDHFPGFPVMPGVLMLEALTQAGAWLVRDMEDFANSIIILKQAKTIKYGSFVEPGRQLELRVEMTAHDPKDISFKGVGVIDGQEMVKGRFTLTRYNLRDRDPELHTTDSAIVSGLRDLYTTLRKGSVGARAIARRPEVHELPAPV
jgi:3-hydroxyacyl-[acyl-carrier-protein] dehydratase